MNDIAQTGCNILTIGQYLRPSKEHLPVAKFIDPSDFEHYKSIGKKIGFKYVESSVFTRSSYHAENAYDNLLSRKT
jgi:lipoic acid synthetase